MEGQVKRLLAPWTDARGALVDCVHRDQRILVGTSHLNKRGKPRHQLIEGIQEGTTLVLVPEPDNPVDRNAILVYRNGELNDDIGYVDAAGAKRICALMERGAEFRAEVCWVDRRKSFLKVYLYVFQMSFPTVASRPRRGNSPEYRATVSRRPSSSLKPAPPHKFDENTLKPIEDVGILRRLINFLHGA